jgi:hypothetical protein
MDSPMIPGESVQPDGHVYWLAGDRRPTQQNVLIVCWVQQVH